MYTSITIANEEMLVGGGDDGGDDDAGDDDQYNIHMIPTF